MSILSHHKSKFVLGLSSACFFATLLSSIVGCSWYAFNAAEYCTGAVHLGTWFITTCAINLACSALYLPMMQGTSWLAKASHTSEAYSFSFPDCSTSLFRISFIMSLLYSILVFFGIILTIINIFFPPLLLSTTQTQSLQQQQQHLAQKSRTRKASSSSTRHNNNNNNYHQMP